MALTQYQIDKLQEYIRLVEESGHGWIVVVIQGGVVRYIIPAPSLDFVPEDSGKDIDKV